MLRLSALILLSLICCAAADQGCSVKLDGKSKIKVDRFIDSSMRMAVHVDKEDIGFEAWIKPAAHGIESSGIILATGVIWADEPKSYVLSYDHAMDAVRVEVWQSQNNSWHAEVISTYLKSLSQEWTHVAFSTRANALYINGTSRTTFVTRKSDALPLSLFRFAIGTNFTGSIDEVRLWNKSLTSADVLNSKDVTMCPNSADQMLLHLPFDECSGNVTMDASEIAACGRLSSNYPFYRSGERRGYGHRGHHNISAKSGEKSPVPFQLVDVHVTYQRPSYHSNPNHPQPNPEHPYGQSRPNHDQTHASHGQPRPSHDTPPKHRRWAPRGNSITYDPNSPAVVSKCASSPASASVQCPYNAINIPYVPATNSSSSSDSSGIDGSDSIDASSSSDTSRNGHHRPHHGRRMTVIHIAWVVGGIVVLLTCFRCCRTMRRKKCVSSQYQPLSSIAPDSASSQKVDHDVYPGNFSTSTPSSAEEVNPLQPPIMDPRMFYMYMPQNVPAHMQLAYPHLQYSYMPMMYSPNLPRANQPEEVNNN